MKQGDWSHDNSKLNDASSAWPTHNRGASGPVATVASSTPGSTGVLNRAGWPVSSTDSNSIDSPTNAASTPVSGVPPASIAASSSQQLDQSTPPSQPNQPVLPASTTGQWDSSNPSAVPPSTPSIPSSASTTKSQVSGDISATSSVSGDSGSTQPRTRQDIMSQVCNIIYMYA